MANLSLRGVSKKFHGRRGELLALEDVRLEVPDGEFLMLVGPSGCGKSTLLNIVAGLDAADSGQVLEDGQPVTGPGRDRSVVFQDGALFPWLTAQKNVEFGLRQMNLPRPDRAERAAYFLETVGLRRFRHSYPHELSGGMRQRVAIARALALDPQVLLMDEPFASLDALTREDLYGQLHEIWERSAKTILFVTHNVREAVCLGDRVVIFSARPGRIRTEFRVELERPRSIDDVEVARAAQQIAAVLRGPDGEVCEETTDAKHDTLEADLLCGTGRVLGAGL